MKNRYLLFAFWLLAAAVQAQNFRPFRPGGSYEYAQAGADTVYSLRLEHNGIISMGDSLYKFSQKVGRSYNQNNQVSCQQYRYADNLFGRSFYPVSFGLARGAYVLEVGDWFAGGPYDSFALYPRAPLNQPWNFGPFTARVTARGVVPVLGQPDSVATITLSNGEVIRLSKNYGLVEGPAVLDYVTRRPAAVRHLTLTALPGRVGPAVLTPQAIYDFQPGDVFWYTSAGRTGMSATGGYYSNTYADSILTRTSSRNGDTITYRLWRCGSGQTTAPGMVVVKVFNNGLPQLRYATDEYYFRARNPHGSVRPLPAVRRAAWYGRVSWVHQGNYVPSGGFGSPVDSSCVRIGLTDNDQRWEYATGLGQTSYREENTTCCYQSINLIGYRKGAERWGAAPWLTCRPTQPATARPSRPAASTTAFPNPFGNDLTAAFVLARPQAVAAELHDALGRVVREVPAAPFAVGSQRLKINALGLPMGIYTLHLHFIGEGRSEVLRVTCVQ